MGDCEITDGRQAADVQRGQLTADIELSVRASEYDLGALPADRETIVPHSEQQLIRMIAPNGIERKGAAIHQHIADFHSCTEAVTRNRVEAVIVHVQHEMQW